MPEPSAHTRVCSYGGLTPKVRRELYALEEFCNRMRSRHKASYRMVPIDDALERGLVIRVDGSTVDGVLCTSRGHVAVELLGYSPLGDRGDVMKRDFSLREKIKGAISEELKARFFSLSLGYQAKRRQDPKLGKVRSVPHEQDFERVIEELRVMVSEAPALEFNHFLSIQFVKPEIAKSWGTRRGTLYLDKTRFPVCAAHFTRVSFQGLNDSLLPHVDSDLSAGFIGIDAEWLREQVRRKADKSLEKSRERANGLPLWLIVHSDGHAINQTIPERHRSLAVELGHEVLRASAHGFARVYWADRTAFLDAAWVGRVL